MDMEQVHEEVAAMAEMQLPGILPVHQASKDATEVSSMSQSMAKQLQKYKNANQDSQKDISKAEGEVEAEVKEELETAFNEGLDQVTEMLDDMEDDLLPPLDKMVHSLTQLMTSCAPSIFRKCWSCLGRWLASAPALIHLVLIELLPMWFFLFSVRSVLTSVSKEFIKIGEKGEDNDRFITYQLEDGTGSFKYWKGLTEYCDDRDVHESQLGHCINKYSCIMLQSGRNGSLRFPVWNPCGKNEYAANPTACDELTEDEDCVMSDYMSFMILWGAYLIVFLMMLYIIMSFYSHRLGSKQLQHGSYLQFCLDIKRRATYRYLSGLLTVCATLSLASLLVLMVKYDTLDWAVQNALLDLIATALSMRAFTRPYKPKFNTVNSSTGDFSELQFQRKFFEGSGGFCARFSSALLQASRLPGAPLLRGMLKLPSEDQRAYVRRVQKICERPASQSKKPPASCCLGCCGTHPPSP